MGWYNSNWGKRRKLTIASAEVNSDLTDFVVYVDLSSISGISNAGAIRVTKADGTTELAREVVSSDELHFKAPSISSSSDTEFYLYYDNSSASDYADTDTYGTHNVWTNSVNGVWHMQEDPSGTAPQIKDSSGNNIDGTTEGSMTSGDLLSDGQLGNTIAFDGTDDAVDLGSPAGLEITGAITLMAWTRPDSDTDPNDNGARVISKSDGGTGDHWSLNESDVSGYGATFRIDSNEIAKADITADVWHHHVGTYDGATQILYVDNVQEASQSLSVSIPTANNVRIGRHGTSNDGRIFNGDIDEVRAYSRALSADEVDAIYTNGKSPGTFYTVGSEETQSNTGQGNVANGFGLSFLG